MIILNPNYISANFSFPGTNTLVVLNGVYQSHLSTLSNLIFSEKTLIIPKNTKVETPLHLLFLTSHSFQDTFNILVEDNSAVTLIEEHASLGEDTYTKELHTGIRAKLNTQLLHYKLQFDHITQACHHTTVTIEQAKNSKITSTFISKGAQIAKDTLHIKLMDDHAAYSLQGINLLTDKQELSNHISIEHLAPNCRSNVLAKSIVDDQASNTFECRVIAYPGATKTETHVTNKNLLLAERAKANAAPELEIYVDDVICTHGVTVGQLDQDALFYLRARGVPTALAIKILLLGFSQEILAHLPSYERYKTMVGLTDE